MLRGGCLCGGVRYEIRGEPGWITHCHCSICRKAHGAAFRTRIAVPSESFRFALGEDLLSRYESSSGVVRTFCRVCGSPIINIPPGEASELGVALGTLDDDPSGRPTCHVYVGSKAPWYEITDALPQFDELPPSGLFPGPDADHRD